MSEEPIKPFSNLRYPRLPSVRVSAEFKRSVLTTAASHNLTYGSYLRRVLGSDSTQSRKRPAPTQPQLIELIRQVAGIGRNINQIAKHLNSGAELSPHTLAIIEQGLGDFNRASNALEFLAWGD